MHKKRYIVYVMTVCVVLTGCCLYLANVQSISLEVPKLEEVSVSTRFEIMHKSTMSGIAGGKGVFSVSIRNQLASALDLTNRLTLVAYESRSGKLYPIDAFAGKFDQLVIPSSQCITLKSSHCNFAFGKGGGAILYFFEFPQGLRVLRSSFEVVSQNE